MKSVREPVSLFRYIFLVGITLVLLLKIALWLQLNSDIHFLFPIFPFLFMHIFFAHLFLCQATITHRHTFRLLKLTLRRITILVQLFSIIIRNVVDNQKGITFHTSFTCTNSCHKWFISTQKCFFSKSIRPIDHHDHLIVLKSVPFRNCVCLKN